MKIVLFGISVEVIGVALLLIIVEVVTLTTELVALLTINCGRDRYGRMMVNKLG
jgi:hypothetical protein